MFLANCCVGLKSTSKKMGRYIECIRPKGGEVSFGEAHF
jgi:hypothetical protein